MKKSIFAVSLLIAVSLCTSCANNNRDEDITPYETSVTAGTTVTETIIYLYFKFSFTDF